MHEEDFSYSYANPPQENYIRNNGGILPYSGYRDDRDQFGFSVCDEEGEQVRMSRDAHLQSTKNKRRNTFQYEPTNGGRGGTPMMTTAGNHTEWDVEMDNTTTSEIDIKYESRMDEQTSPNRNSIFPPESNTRYIDNDVTSLATSVKLDRRLNDHENVVEQLRKEGVKVINTEIFSNLYRFLDNTSWESCRRGDSNNNFGSCFLYTDSVGRVYNVILSVSLHKQLSIINSYSYNIHSF